MAQVGLPPTLTTGCGHTFCSSCANNSLLTKPPMAICFVCGKRASYIAKHPDHKTEPAPAWGSSSKTSKLPEFFTSGNLFAHHVQRYFQMRNVPFNSATIQHVGGFPLQRIPVIDNPEGGHGYEELADLREKLRNQKAMMKTTSEMTDCLEEWGQAAESIKNKTREATEIIRDMFNMCARKNVTVDKNIVARARGILTDSPSDEDALSDTPRSLPSPSHTATSSAEEDNKEEGNSEKEGGFGNITLGPATDDEGMMSSASHENIALLRQTSGDSTFMNVTFGKPGRPSTVSL